MSIRKGTTLIAGNVMLDATPTQNSTRGITSGGVYGVEKVETVYDADSNDIALNWGYTNGIPHETTITGKDFSKYKKLRIFVGASNLNYTGVAEVNFNLLTNLKYQATNCYEIGGDGGMHGRVVQFQVNSEKTEFKVYISYVLFSNGTETHDHKLMKIEGVY